MGCRNMHEQLAGQTNKEETKRRLLFGAQLVISVFLLAAGAVVLIFFLRENHYYASGNDAWGHLFKSNLMYQNLKKGNIYPLFTNLWYNGVQPYRYWGPLTYYILAGLQWLAGGDIEASYYLFAGVSFFIGGIGWLLWGISTRRMLLCAFISLTWFFLPENIRVYFCEGNIPRMVTAIIIPYLVYFIWLFVTRNKNWAVFFIAILVAMMALSHLMISAMMGIASFIFLLIWGFENKKMLKPAEVIVSMLLGYVLAGIWIVPALIGGLVAMNSEASASVMESLTYSLSSTLDPFNRISGITDTFYYGISIIAIAVIGIVLSEKKWKAGYYTNIIILICTTPAMVPLLSKLPLSQLLWMMRFATIAYAFFLWSFIEWKNLRRFMVLFLCILLAVDCIPSLNIDRYYTQSKGAVIDELAAAKQITSQRVAIIDLSYLGSYPSWELCNGDKPVQYTFGWAWQGASTATNIVMLNTAIEKGHYEFLFDRCVELGNDTVIVLKELIAKANETEEHLVEAAAMSGYQTYLETDKAIVFHFDAPPAFAIKTRYKGFGIGAYVDQIVFPYPTFIGESMNIEDYDIDELAEYETLYLSGFEYYTLENAERIVKELADRGVRVVIDMNHIPVVEENKRMYFLGVVAQDISFETMFPTINFKGETMYMSRFPEEYSTWNTKYIEGVQNVWGTADYYGQELSFVGTNNNDNIIFLGFNLLYFCTQTEDENAYKILDECFDTRLYELPKREIIPIKIDYSFQKIVIDTPEANVNTAIAFQDNFVSNDGIINQNHLLFVTKKHTEITLIYPYLKQGMLVSMIGVILTILWAILIARIDRRKKTGKVQEE